MNIYKVLNEITLYIENHLEEEIDYHILAKKMGVNTYTMQRIFSVLTNITLTEYIRKRRLSVAAYDLLVNKMKVIDVAMKYQYTNSTSFSRAFESYHKIKPSKINNNTKIKEFPRILFDENIKIKKAMEYSVVEFPKLTLYGVGIKTNNKKIGKDAPNLFKKVESKEKQYGRVKYGMTSYEDLERCKCVSYHVLYEKKIEELEKVVIPKSKWLTFKIPSQKSTDIQKLTRQVYEDFLPSCKYNLRNIPELEYYHDDITEFCIPII